MINGFMSDTSSLKINLLGRILGSHTLVINQTEFSAVSKKSKSSIFDLKNIRSFGFIHMSFFGASFSFKYEEQELSFKFLSKKNAKAFAEAFNCIAKDSIESYLIKVFSEFNLLVIKNYPRDSYYTQIESLISQLHQYYSYQTELWHELLDPNDISRVQEILKHFPLNIDHLRLRHENDQLRKRKGFYDVVESNPLTHEQRLGVIRSNDRNMVLAAAGTGKTSVMVAKALDLIDRQLALPSEILILAYNKGAAVELSERLTEKARNSNVSVDSLPQISTFHALGRKILKESGIPVSISVYAEDPFRLEQWVTNWIHEYIGADPSRVFDLIELTTPPVDPFDFKTQGEYEKHLRDNEFRTLNNELVKGYQELTIANFLHINQIEYEYESQFVTKRRIEVGFDYRPDFHIVGTDIYIEHYGVDRNGNTRPDIDASSYGESMHQKELLHKECGTVLLETYHYEWKENTLLENLKAKLAASGISCNPLHPSEIFEKLNGQKQLSSWSELMKKALQAIRVERLDEEQIVSRLKKFNIHQPKKYATLLDALHTAYKHELARQNSIDFDDMILRAIQVVEDGSYKPKWKYILVDEFQDISEARMDFVRAIIDKGPHPSLTVVGDDWQSIYRFSGGKLELTTRFDELVGNYTPTMLQKTFRYNNSIANTAGQFVMENPEQYQKNIVTHTQVKESQVYLLDDKIGNNDGVYERVLEVVRKIRENAPSASIAIIARYNYLLADTKTLLWGNELKDNIHFWSFHKSKGLEADYCILIGFFQGKSGFPNENRDDAVVEALLPSLDSYSHSEERRLLYVGLTRAKHKSYIIADPTSPSEFVSELLAPKYELNISSKAFQEQFKKMFDCPNCESGVLRLIKGKFNNFYACSTGRGCKVGKARVCNKCHAPSIDTRSESICNNPACLDSIKICEKCGRPMKKRSGKFGEFWGCSGYGIKDDQCTHTAK